MSQDTGAAKLPGLPILKTEDQALARWAQAVAEHLEVRAGARGNPKERAVTVRELEGLSRTVSNIGTGARAAQAGDMAFDLGGGLTASLSVDAFSKAIRESKLFKDLTLKLDDPTRFDDLPAEVKRVLLLSIAEEAARRGADISVLETKLQSATDSLALRVEEVTAAVEGAAAGVRAVTYAYADADRATAGRVTQVQARLNNFSDGTPGTATVEEKMTATANRATGLEAQYTVKVNAGGAIAGFGLAAGSNLAGVETSDFMVQADRFSLMSAINFSQELIPSATVAGQTWYKPSTKVYSRATALGTGSWTAYSPVIPFGVDTTTGTTFINGQVRINAGGPTILEGIKGDPGSPGLAGTRGSLTGYGKNYSVYAASWADGAATSGAYLANRVIDNMLTGGTAITELTTSTHLRIGDTITLTDAAAATTATTKYWSGTSWIAPGVILDGNLLVKGTVSASRLNAGSGATGVAIAGGTSVTNAAGTAITNGVYVYQNSSALYGLYCKNDYGGGVGSTANTGGAAYFQSVGGFTLDAYNNASPFQGVTTSVRAVSGRSEYGVGVLGLTGSSAGIGVYAQGTAPGLALYANGRTTLNGDVNIQGNLTVSGTSPGGAGGGVTTFNSRSGAVALTAGDVTGALGATAVQNAGYANSAGSAGSANSASTAVSLLNSTYSLAIQTSDGNLILKNGTTAIWSSQTGVISDRTRKDDIQATTTAGLDTIGRLAIVDFRWKPGFLESNGGLVQTGLIAQEVQSVIPNAVKVINGLHLLDKGEIVPHLVKAVQELHAEVILLRAQRG